MPNSLPAPCEHRKKDLLQVNNLTAASVSILVTLPQRLRSKYLTKKFFQLFNVGLLESRLDGCSLNAFREYPKHSHATPPSLWRSRVHAPETRQQTSS